MEHIEPAGIHSGDSNAVLPQFNLTPLVVHTMEEYAEKIARAFNIQGLSISSLPLKTAMYL
jgi:carbamoyl-phosphate synthase large subunit